MSLISANDLTGLRADQSDAMWDTCVVQAWSGTANAYSELIETYTDGSAIACRFVPDSGTESRRANMTQVIMPALVRLPLGTTVTAKDRIKVTKRFGTTLATPLVFGVDDAGISGATCVTVKLKDVD
jgi:head-tail adaptor